ncbi:MAG: hypothetical protein ACLVCH_12700 [Roseburia inulinivorans]
MIQMNPHQIAPLPGEGSAGRKTDISNRMVYTTRSAVERRGKDRRSVLRR